MSKPQWLKTGWATHSGRRQVNEDAVLVSGALMAVADGVGGAPRGDLASLEAVEAIREAIDEPDLNDPKAAGLVASELDHALNVADAAVKSLADQWAGLSGAATTMCAAIIFNDPAGRGRAVVANVGDSRCYQIRGRAINQVTRDQTLASQLEDAGIDDIADRAHSIVTSVLGGSSDAAPVIDVRPLTLEPEDILLLCSDGVSGVLPAEKLASICTGYRDRPNMAATALLRQAWEAGSTDNLSAAVACIEVANDPDE